MSTAKCSISGIVVAVVIFVVHPLPPGIWMYLPLVAVLRLAVSTESTYDRKATISGLISPSFFASHQLSSKDIISPVTTSVRFFPLF